MFFKYFNFKGPKLLGLDVSSSAVKLLELSQTNGQHRVESFGIAPLPVDAFDENRLYQPQAITDAVTKLIETCRPDANAAAIAINSSLVITKVVQVDASLSETEIEQQIRLQEAPRILPFPMEEVSLDFEIMGPNHYNEAQLDVLIAASRAEHVEGCVAAIEASGLDVKVVDVESYAMERAFQKMCAQLQSSDQDATVAIIDIGSALTKITVLHNLQTVYYREEMFGSRLLTEAIQQHFGLSLAEAGLAKKNGSLGEEYVKTVLEPFRQSLVPLVRRSLQFFFSASHFDHVDHILLAGGGALTVGLEEVLTDQIGIPTSIANPFANMSMSSNVNPGRLHNDAPTLMIACGLALRSC